jgi:hypothetical protein
MYGIIVLIHVLVEIVLSAEQPFAIDAVKIGKQLSRLGGSILIHGRERLGMDRSIQ